MLTDADLLMIKATRDELTAKRKRPVSLLYYDVLRDDFTGEIIGKTEHAREVEAVVTELSTGSERYVDGGIEYEKGDIMLAVDIELMADIEDDLERVKHDGKDYEILASDKKGIGIRNRYEILGRLIA